MTPDACDVGQEMWLTHRVSRDHCGLAELVQGIGDGINHDSHHFPEKHDQNSRILPHAKAINALLSRTSTLPLPSFPSLGTKLPKMDSGLHPATPTGRWWAAAASSMDDIDGVPRPGAPDWLTDGLVYPVIAFVPDGPPFTFLYCATRWISGGGCTLGRRSVNRSVCLPSPGEEERSMRLSDPGHVAAPRARHHRWNQQACTTRGTCVARSDPQGHLTHSVCARGAVCIP